MLTMRLNAVDLRGLDCFNLDLRHFIHAIASVDAYKQHQVPIRPSGIDAKREDVLKVSQAAA